MSRVLVTGSSDGIGLMVGQLLADTGHEVVLHARNDQRAADARALVPRAAEVVVGDLSTIAGMVAVAEGANCVGLFDAVVHNAAVGPARCSRIVTVDGLSEVFAVNVLAPYVLTALIARPRRLVYVSSRGHWQGTGDLGDLQWEKREWDGVLAYDDTKLFDIMLAFGVARRWPDVCSNAIEPGWIATKMGGPDAPGDPALAPVTQAWLAVSAEADAVVSGEYFFHQERRDAHPAVREVELQDELLERCAALSGFVLTGPA